MFSSRLTNALEAYTNAQDRTTSHSWTELDEQEFTVMLERELDKVHDFQKAKVSLALSFSQYSCPPSRMAHAKVAPESASNLLTQQLFVIIIFCCQHAVAAAKYSLKADFTS